MGSVPVNTDGTGEKGFAELNYHRRYEHKEVRDGVVGEGQGLSEEDESRINEVTEAVHNERERTTQTQDGLQKQQQQPQPPGPAVCWERFLPLRSLKVLLVENDDSTRHVVSALLRNCSYEVTAAANGVQAWRILQDLTNHIDLVLTEVVMPCLSGIGLLCKIMSHKTCKNIPVIMMSSHDSMGIVFKCLSKGAVDFLVKPIRKNELKNLWQHVWRRCHSSSGSGSESGIQTQKSVKSKTVEGSDNNTGSNDEDDNGSIGLGVRDGSDNGSGTQSSWTKRAVEVDSPQPLSPWNQLADPPDSTCGQAIHPKSEGLDNERVPVMTKKECQEQDEESHENVQMGKDLEIGVPGNPDLQHEYASEKVHTNLTVTDQDKLPALDLGKDTSILNEGALELNREKPLGELRTQVAADSIGLISNCIVPPVETSFSEAPHGLCRISEIKDKANSDTKELPSLELSLKRLRSIGDVGSAAHDERNVLRRSDLSAFSRYNTVSTANQAPTGNVGSCSPLDNSSDAMKAESMYNQQSNGSSNNNDMGSTTKSILTKSTAFNEKSVSTSTARCLHPSAFQLLQNGRACPPSQSVPQKADNVVVTTVLAQPRGAHQQVQVQHHHHHYHHHHHHVHDKQQQQPPPENDDLSLNIATGAMQCGSSNLFGSVEGNGGNNSLNGSVSGSNHGSNGQNGSSKAVNIGGMNIESDNGKSEAGGGSGSGSGSGMEQNRFAQREAALNKFRQKRKERCFEKKVRYQSRKRLAEQRPRVRGQFVRQIVYEHTSREENS
ncbi:Signal transduction response regulator [Macleaya cordata]|uniref:Signal transduction response regulator n=1 Tax=Macleaya cordata TaxID=56857 RepID=A0A200R6A2_MACCD|nr:Signal transduction response regulator [Macleaya cordata]